MGVLKVMEEAIVALSGILSEAQDSISDKIDVTQGEPEERLFNYGLRDALRGENVDVFLETLTPEKIVTTAFMLGQMYVTEKEEKKPEKKSPRKNSRKSKVEKKKVNKPSDKKTEPPVEEPSVEPPVEEEPAVEEPAVEEPAVEPPVEEEPAVEEPETVTEEGSNGNGDLSHLFGQKREEGIPEEDQPVEEKGESTEGYSLDDIFSNV